MKEHGTSVQASEEVTVEHKQSGEEFRGETVPMAMLCKHLGTMPFSSSLCVVGEIQVDKGCHLLNCEVNKRPDPKSNGGDSCGGRPDVYITEKLLESVLVTSHHCDKLAHRNNFKEEVFILVGSWF